MLVEMVDGASCRDRGAQGPAGARVYRVEMVGDR